MKRRKPTTPSIQRHIQDFFEKYLPVERNASQNTIVAYRDGLKLFLQHAAETTAVAVDRLDHSIFDADTVRSFLAWLEKERHCGPRTRNQRLAVIKTFARYLGSVAPEHLERCRRIRELRKAAYEKSEPEYLDMDELSLLLKACMHEPRDRALLLLLYNTGARVQELVDLDLQDIRLEIVPLVTIEGKGQRQRTCPLWERTVTALKDWSRLRGDHEGPLFHSRQGRRLTRSGVAYILRGMQAKADLEPKHARRVTPHVIRHTTAMHLLQSKVDLTTIAAWLGHAQTETTNGYVDINLRMKQQALAAAASIPELRRGRFPRGGLLAWLNSLGRSQTYAKPPPRRHWRPRKDLQQLRISRDSS